MTNVNDSNILEANLGRLLFGDRSPMLLHVCLKPDDPTNESLASLDPFEMINLGVGRRYFLARLSTGKGFSEQFILLNIYNANNDKNAVDELVMLERYRDEDRIPLPAVIDFNTGYQASGDSSHSPAFYCRKTRQFFNVECVVCSGTLEYKKDDDCLYCPRCNELDEKAISYSFYESFDDKNVTLLEDVFSQYAQTDSASKNMPCSGCKHAKKCFPQVEKSSTSVVNEFHHIIPFSYEPFSVYGFSYFPLNLIDYCELVSGKSKTDLLDKLSTSKESGRYRVLSESGSFTQRLNEQNYLTVKMPDVASILSIKLRVFMRLCDAMNRFGEGENISGIAQAGINMDLEQMYAAGDSFTRARMVFLPPSVNLIGSIVFDESHVNKHVDADSAPTTLSDILFLMFFKNKKSNELRIEKAVDELVLKIGGEVEVSLDKLSKIISSSDELSLVFSAKSLFYYDVQSGAELTLKVTPQLTPQLTQQLSQIVLMIVRLGLILSQRINAQIFSSSEGGHEPSVYSFVKIIHVIKEMFSHVDYIRTSQLQGQLTPEVDEQLLESALREIIKDEAWLDSIFSKTSAVNGAAIPPVENVYDSENDKTLIAPTDYSELDKTVVSGRQLPDDVEADDVMIMSSINRILRQL